MFHAVRKRLSRKGSRPLLPDKEPPDEVNGAYSRLAEDKEQVDLWQQTLDVLVARAKIEVETVQAVRSETSTGPSPRTARTCASSQDADDDAPIGAVRSEPIDIQRVESVGPDGATVSSDTASSPPSISIRDDESGSQLSTCTSVFRRSYSSSTLTSSTRSVPPRGWTLEMQMHGYGVSPDTQECALAAYRRQQRHTESGTMFVRPSPGQV